MRHHFGARAFDDDAAVMQHGDAFGQIERDVLVDADSNLTADANANGFGAALIGVAVAVMYPTAEIGGATRGWISGNTALNTKNVSVTADSVSLATADTVSVGIGIIGAGAAGAPVGLRESSKVFPHLDLIPRRELRWSDTVPENCSGTQAIPGLEIGSAVGGGIGCEMLSGKHNRQNCRPEGIPTEDVASN